MIFWSLFFFCVLTMLIIRFKFREEFTWGEFGIGAAILLLVLGGGYLIATHAQTADTQILSGKVTDKKKDRVGCRHSYSCNCTTYCSGGKNPSCSTVCQTCYEHSYDIDWDVFTTVGEITIDTIDRQGLREPPRWTSVKTGEPASVMDSYDNWLKAVPDSVFRRTTEEKLPEYPLKVYDYYHIDRVVNDGLNVPKEELKSLNEKISLSLVDIAKEKQVNLVIVLTNRTSMFAQELRAGWLNGKKNDMVVVIGAKEYPKIEWVDVFGWSSNDLAHISARDSIREYGVIDNSVVDLAVASIGKYWSRRPMQEYEYLKDEIEISDGWLVALAIIGVVIVVGGSIIFINKEII